MNRQERQEKAVMNIHDGMIRVSLGIQDPQDIIAGLKQALARTA